jgi:pterin-4a-carbinolamine dehydratase
MSQTVNSLPQVQDINDSSTMSDHMAIEPFTFFISYRRQDTAPIALLLKNELEKRLRFVRVFVDVEAIEPGQHFPARITNFINAAHATIVLIGERWMPRRDTATGLATTIVAGEPVPTDWVVEEVEQSHSLPLTYTGTNTYGLSNRLLIPLFIDTAQNFSQFVLPAAVMPLSNLNALHIAYANWPSAIGPLLESIARQVNLESRPDADPYPRADPAKARTHPISEAELVKILQYDDYNGWYLDNYGHSDVRYLVKNFKFDNFEKASSFMQQAAALCSLLEHHPEWRNVYNHVTVALTTWDAHRRVTIYDLNLALLMNKVADATGQAN